MSQRYRKSILILESQPNVLNLARTYLSNREFTIYSTSSLKDALNYLVEKRPTFFMISVDFPNRMVMQLPEAIKDTSSPNTCVFFYAEKNIASSVQLLVDSRGEYLLYPPVTGPSIERAANRYFRSLAQKTLDARQTEARQRQAAAALAKERLKQQAAPETEEIMTKLIKGESVNNVVSITSGKPKAASAPVVKPVAQNSAPQTETLATVSVLGATNASIAATLATDEEDYMCMMTEVDGRWGYMLAKPTRPEQLKGDRLNSLSTKMKERNPGLARSEPFLVKLKRTLFEAWANTVGQVGEPILHEGETLLVAFIPSDAMPPFLEPAEIEGMFRVRLDDIPTDFQLQYNVYVHLKLNHRFVLYVKRGSYLSQERRDHLRSKGVTHFHVLKLEGEDFHATHAQVFLNGKIDAFAGEEPALELAAA